MDWYFLAVAIALFMVLLIANTYFLAYNAHPSDTKFGSHTVMRIVVVRMIAIIAL